MDKHKVYCDECKFLEERKVKAEIPPFSGKYVQTGTRYHCSKHDRWFPINTSLELVGFSFCVKGEKR